MGALKRKMRERDALVRSLGCRVRALGLDAPGEVTPEQDALASSVLAEHPWDVVREALGFSGYLSGLADSACRWCSGSGAAPSTRCAHGVDRSWGRLADGREGFVPHCEDGPYEPCECVLAAERVVRSRAQETAQAWRSEGDRRGDIDRRVGAAEAQLAAAVARRDAATKDLDARLAEVERSLGEYRSRRAILDGARVEWCGDVDRFERAVASLEKAREGAEAQVREVDRKVVELVEANRGLIAEAEHITAERDRVARHHEPTVDRARRRLRRLKFLRGDKSSE